MRNGLVSQRTEKIGTGTYIPNQEDKTIYCDFINWYIHTIGTYLLVTIFQEIMWDSIYPTIVHCPEQLIKITLFIMTRPGDWLLTDALCTIFTILLTLWNCEQKNGLLIKLFLVFHPILMKLGEIVVQMHG